MEQWWNAEEYTNSFSFVYKYGEDILSLIDLPGGSFCVDLGCGNGALTQKLAQKGYRVLGLDASPSMVEKARAAYPGLPFQVADALSFRLDRPADGIFSNAVFHWIDEARQPLLARNLAANLRPGGVLACEFGGKGNNEKIHGALSRALRRRGLPYRRGFYFPSLARHCALLEGAGLSVRAALLFERPTPLAGGREGLRRWIKMFIQGPCAEMAPAEKEEVLAQVEEELRPILWDEEKGGWMADYVRLRLRAVKE